MLATCYKEIMRKLLPWNLGFTSLMNVPEKAHLFVTD